MAGNGESPFRLHKDGCPKPGWAAKAPEFCMRYIYTLKRMKGKGPSMTGGAETLHDTNI